MGAGWTWLDLEANLRICSLQSKPCQAPGSLWWWTVAPKPVGKNWKIVRIARPCLDHSDSCLATPSSSSLG